MKRLNAISKNLPTSTQRQFGLNQNYSLDIYLDKAKLPSATNKNRLPYCL